MKQVIYHYDKTGMLKEKSFARENPLEKGKFLIPANATIEKPPSCLKTEEVYFLSGWKVRLKKLPPPSKYHIWDDKKGWSISSEDQKKLDEEIKKETLSTEINEKIIIECRRVAIENLKARKEIPQDYEE
ncbi:MAG: hypothetical protein GY714_20335 [Desulfobacterales bacterium]|nr:hypothetical protein [Desulfobacterales bacterium]